MGRVNNHFKQLESLYLEGSNTSNKPKKPQEKSGNGEGDTIPQFTTGDTKDEEEEQITFTFWSDLPGITVSVVDNATDTTWGR